MKRAMLSMAAAALAAGVAACSPSPPARTGDEPQAAREWARPPVIERVARAGSALLVSGVADKEARVVLRSDDGDAFAATADSRGRFEIRVPGRSGHLLLRPETQVGQDAAPSPDHLLILAGGQGPIAVLRPGGPALRLDAAPTLGAIDSDGRMRLASGRVAAGTDVIDVRSGGETVQVAPDAEGRWEVILPAGDGAEQIGVGGREYRWPGEGDGAQALRVERIETGWRIRWAGPGDAVQTTWLPDLAAP